VGWGLIGYWRIMSKYRPFTALAEKRTPYVVLDGEGIVLLGATRIAWTSVVAVRSAFLSKWQLRRRIPPTCLVLVVDEATRRRLAGLPNIEELTRYNRRLRFRRSAIFPRPPDQGAYIALPIAGFGVAALSSHLTANGLKIVEWASDYASAAWRARRAAPQPQAVNRPAAHPSAE
jgi:hypothetical protein